MSLHTKIYAFLLLLAALFFNSCASNKAIHYLQNTKGIAAEGTLYENTLQPDDNLLITVTAEEPELAKDFNLIYLNMQSSENRNIVDPTLYSYILDQRGEIDFPVLGKIKLSGLTRIQAEEKIKQLLKNYIVNPGVNLRILNFKVSVVGEVSRPGAVRVTGDRITILEALSECGDMTIYGKRKEVLVIRDKDGATTVASVDITDPKLITSPYYYLAHNDVVYVKQNRTRVNSSVIGPNLTVGISALSLIVTIIALSTR
ncbi:hypothetical protein CHU92_14710 [Flavobacterium cyanobacteriorum]|uniref:Uncharacterized protein n=1 Tax=Flavobacterium cyanobacteriorum TaxID=2022802 RepID=A0A255YSF1_9FLAO|nr:polysaccharide biosynthesis/export family protein [Flavobacterium cyanobacteriorum]OYQ32123.1 hypothetical protein CHU92_14710 [Flavobacterium cyanobacteriorum]